MTGAPSFDEVFDEGVRYVSHVLRRMGVPENDQEDRVQDVFLAVCQSLPTYDPTRPLLPWLHGIAFHVARKHYVRNPREVLMDDVAEPIDQALDPEQATAETRQRELLIRLMQELDLDHRVVVSMYIDEIEMPDIARELGISIATGYERLATARRKLQAALVREQRRRRASGAAVVVPLNLATLFAAERNIPDVSADFRARIRARVQAATRALPAAGSAPPSPAGSAVSSAARAAARVAARVAPYVLSAAAGAAGMYLYMRPAQPLQPPAPIARGVLLPSPSGRVPSSLATAPAAPASSAPEPAASVATVTASTVTSATAAAEDDEESLMSRARSAHARGQTSIAIDALNAHARKYPHGELAGEREQLRAVLEHERLAGSRARPHL